MFFRFFCAHTSINKSIVCKICCLSNGHKLRIEGTQEWEQIRLLWLCICYLLWAAMNSKIKW